MVDSEALNNPVFPNMPLCSVRHLLVVSLVVAAHAGVICLLASGLQNRPTPDVTVPSVLTVGLVTPQPRVAAPVASSPAPAAPALAQAPARPAAPRPTPPTPAPVTPSLPALAQTAALSDRLQTLSEVADAAPDARPAEGMAAATGGQGSGHASTVFAPAGATSAPQIQLPSAAASFLDNPPPRYPLLSRRLGEQGKVIVRARIEIDGTASGAEINTSSGYSRLDQTALQTVLSWRYIPGTRNGVPQAMWFYIPIHFVLE